ncbi:MAG TPA: phosphoribosyl-ATP diphosphatase [Reyranella sp.]|jgi:phosphoribosyl-ATP pyrophosphohydrolase|nr:phosphoribosyl-ATP diphosphatase [Reyranella sp.]
MTFSLEALNQRVAERASVSPEESYTAKLLHDGIDRCARKFGEEAVETIVAAVARDRSGVALEAADVLYHLLVLLKASGVTLDEVMAELDRRTGQSGLAEKASRQPS